MHVNLLRGSGAVASSIRIGAGQGFYGDTADGALDVARSGDVRYICFDALAELTMAILSKDRLRDPSAGYARDLPDFLERLLPVCREQGIKLITNAGGINPQGAAAAAAKVGSALGMDDLRIATVVGDGITARIDELRAAGAPLRHLDTGADLDGVRSRIVMGNAYLGARPVVEALQRDADVVVTGRVADASLFVAPMVHELGWGWEDWDRLAAGVVLGHLMECSAQSTGGNFSGDWWNVDLDRIGYPVCEMREDGTALLTKPTGTGGRVSVDTVKEQLLYEVLDPSAYANPDVVADFTSVRLRDVARDVVEVSGVVGQPRTENLKCILGYLDGWAGTAMMGYSWPDAEAKARRAAELVERIAERNGLMATERVVEVIGVDSVHGPAASADPDVNEVVLRVCCRFETEAEARRFPRLMTQLALNGPPFIGGGATPQSARALLGVWPALLPRSAVEPLVEVDVAEARTWVA
jgi:hypothetical protein